MPAILQNRAVQCILEEVHLNEAKCGVLSRWPGTRELLREDVRLDFKDLSLTCFDCGTAYTFTAEEQQAFQAKGHNHPPKRCPSCRAARAARRPVQNKDREAMQILSQPTIRHMYTVTCTECGKETQVPFEPRAGRPVYCSDCYHKSRVAK